VYISFVPFTGCGEGVNKLTFQGNQNNLPSSTYRTIHSKYSENQILINFKSNYPIS
jgi:hypothetical protein